MRGWSLSPQVPPEDHHPRRLRSLLKINTCSICTRTFLFLPVYYVYIIIIFQWYSCFFVFFTSEWMRFFCCWRVQELLLLVSKDSFFNNLNQAKKEIQRLAFQCLTPPPLLDLTAPGLLPPVAPSASPGFDKLCRALLGIKTAPEQKKPFSAWPTV